MWREVRGQLTLVSASTASSPLQKVVLPMHKHNAASVEQERTQPRAAGRPHGPKANGKLPPPAALLLRTPQGRSQGTPCTQAERFKEEKKKKAKLTEL